MKIEINIKEDVLAAERDLEQVIRDEINLLGRALDALDEKHLEISKQREKLKSLFSAAGIKK